VDQQWLLAIIIGALQEVFEWLPISSEGNITIVLIALGSNSTAAVGYALFLHLGTALSATAYYRDELYTVFKSLRIWRVRDPISSAPLVSFLGIATVVSGVTGLLAYAVLDRIVSALTGGAFIVVVGFLLIATGVLQRVSPARIRDENRTRRS